MIGTMFQCYLLLLLLNMLGCVVDSFMVASSIPSKAAKQWKNQKNNCFNVPSNVKPSPTEVWRSMVNNDDNDADELSKQQQQQQELNRRELFRRVMGDSMVLLSGSAMVVSDDAQATMMDPKRGIVFPSVGEIESAIPPVWDTENPYSDKLSSSLSRLDNNADSIFYEEPRFVEHIDESTTVPILTQYISQELSNIPQTNTNNNPAILDLGASWTSHINLKDIPNNSKITGIGMNAQELKSNKALTDWAVADMNIDGAKLPLDNDTYDLVLCQLSIDYFIRPLQVMKEVGRVLKPGGRVAILFSNRLFLQKAVGIWTGADDIDHAYIVGSYLHYCNGNFENIVAKDLSVRDKKKMVVGDPLYVVTATKQLSTV